MSASELPIPLPLDARPDVLVCCDQPIAEGHAGWCGGVFYAVEAGIVSAEGVLVGADGRPVEPAGDA